MSEKYDVIYQQTHDIDWFCRIGNTAMHFASNGGLLPDQINNRETNSQIQHAVSLIEDVLTNPDQIEINRRYVYERLGGNDSEEAFRRYVESFVAMAKKGFISFDRMLEDNMYMWIARPAVGSKVDVPIDILPIYEEVVCERFASRNDVVHVWCLNKCGILHRKA